MLTGVLDSWQVYPSQKGFEVEVRGELLAPYIYSMGVVCKANYSTPCHIETELRKANVCFYGVEKPAK
jgi:hypothetical protein